MRQKGYIVGFLLLIMTLVSGCLYPTDQRAGHQVSPRESILIVQSAVQGYQELSGFLPFKNSELDTPIFEKYQIDFKRLMDRGLLSSIPSNAFENGGTFIYVLINVEENPEVKLLDLVSVQQAREIQQDVANYRNQNAGQVPYDVAVGGGWYSINYDALGIRPVHVRSVYSEQELGLLVHLTGEIAIDYTPEIMKKTPQMEADEIDPDLDLRTLLVEDSYFVPGQSYPYYWIDDKPQIAFE